MQPWNTVHWESRFSITDFKQPPLLGWLGNKEHLRVSQGTQVQFPAPKSSSSHLLTIPGPEDPTPSPDLCLHLHLQSHTTHEWSEKIKSFAKWKKSLIHSWRKRSEQAIKRHLPFPTTQLYLAQHSSHKTKSDRLDVNTRDNLAVSHSHRFENKLALSLIHIFVIEWNLIFHKNNLLSIIGLLLF